MVQEPEKLEHEPAEQGTRGNIDQVMLLGKDAAQANEEREQENPRPEHRSKMEGCQCGDRGVHAWEAVGAGVKALNEGEEPFGTSTPFVAGAPCFGCCDWEEREEGHLEKQQQCIADGDV